MLENIVKIKPYLPTLALKTSPLALGLADIDTCTPRDQSARLIAAAILLLNLAHEVADHVSRKLSKSATARSTILQASL